jgi:uncharacterized protein YxjI
MKRGKTIVDQTGLIKSVSRKWEDTTGTYVIDIAATKDQTFILALVIIIDQVLYDNHGSQH